MSDEGQPVETNAPFEPQPSDLGGCGKPAVVGCLVLLVLAGIGLIVFLVKARSMLDWALVQYQQVVVENLAEEVGEPERERLDAAFEAARDAIRENRMNPAALQNLQRFMSSPPQPNQPIGPETVRDLTEALEAVAEPGGEAGPEPGPATEPSRTAVLQHAGV